MRNWSIVTKITAAACGLVAVLVILSSLLLVRFEIQKEQALVADFEAEIRLSIIDQERRAEATLRRNVEFTTTILSQSGATDLYNFSADDLQNTLRSYLAYPEFVAIRVLDEIDKPFAAAWKTPEFATGESLPEGLNLDQELSVQFDSLYEGQRVGQFQVFYTNAIIDQEIAQLHIIASEKIKQFAAASHARRTKTITNQFVGVVVILMALMLCLLILLRNLIRNPLATVSILTQKLTDFDLTVNVETTKRDEIGMLMIAIHNMVAAFRKIVGQVQRSGIQVASSSTELSATAKEQEVTMTTQMVSTRSVLKEIEAIATVLGELLQVMQQVSGMSEETAEFASRGQTDLNHLGITMQRMEQASKMISDRLNAIHAKASSITSIVTTITKVADQTNLLSLNAAIEAEKAGEYGRGFTVVAREIRRLADQTAVATLDIEQTVQEMISAVSTGVMEMDKFVAEVRQSVEDVDNIRLELNRIIDQVRLLSPSFDEVKIVMAEQSENADNINGAMLRLSEELQQTTASFQETYTAIQQITDASNSLRDEVSRFKVE